MGPTGDLAFVIIVLGGLAAWVAWGWRSWSSTHERASVIGWFSLAGFVLASISALLQIISGIYAQFVDIPFGDPTLIVIYRVGFWLALLGLLSGIVGSFRKGPLRFKAPSLSAFLLLLWIWHAMAE